MTQSLLINNILYSLYQTNFRVLQSKSMTSAKETAINIILKYIQTHYMEDLSLDAICKHVNFSKSYFCRLFKAYTDVSVHQYLSEYRINKSKELLSYSKLTVTAIAHTVGFKTPLTYSRCFEKYVGMTPPEYRRHF